MAFLSDIPFLISLNRAPLPSVLGMFLALSPPLDVGENPTTGGGGGAAGCTGGGGGALTTDVDVLVWMEFDVSVRPAFEVRFEFLFLLLVVQ